MNDGESHRLDSSFFSNSMHVHSDLVFAAGRGEGDVEGSGFGADGGDGEAQGVAVGGRVRLREDDYVGPGLRRGGEARRRSAFVAVQVVSERGRAAVDLNFQSLLAERHRADAARAPLLSLRRPFL